MEKSSAFLVFVLGVIERQSTCFGDSHPVSFRGKALFLPKSGNGLNRLLLVKQNDAGSKFSCVLPAESVISLAIVFFTRTFNILTENYVLNFPEYIKSI